MPTNNPYNPQLHPESQPGAAPQQFPTPPTPPMPMMPPPKRVQPAAHTWRERLFAGNSGRPLTLRQELTMPEWAVGKSVVVFFIAFVACTLAFGYPVELRYAIISSLSVIIFFYGGKSLLSSRIHANEKIFIRNVFVFGLIARLAWAMYCYFIFNPEYYGNNLGDEADTTWYMPFGAAIADWIRDGFPVPFSELKEIWGSDIGDLGYPIWLALLSILSFGESDVFVPFVAKCIVGAYCGVCIYRVAKRHFGLGAARLASIFVALNPNMIYWCGTMMKESEMVFLCCLCIDLMDRTFTEGHKLSFKGLLPGILIALLIFFFRSVLSIVFFIAMFAHVVMASNKVMSTGKKIIAGVLTGAVLMAGMGNRIISQAEQLMETAQSNSQKTNMEWRSNLTDSRGNKQSFAKYAGAVVFAPLIFTIPFPTFNMANENQLTQMLLSGGSYIKNIFSFYVLLVLLLMLISGEWRKHVFIIAYTVGYLAVLVMSPFAQSGRFHMPIWAMLMLFAAYGIQISKSNPRYRGWFGYALVIEIIICFAWNWFKLKGRGMI